MWFVDSTGKLRRALVDASGHIQIDVLSSPLSALIGEVQAAPTTYTVLDRLKTLATLLNAGLPSALDTGALKVREQNPLASINVGNWPTDFPDAGVAKLLAGGLPSALTSDKLKVRASEIETLLGAGLPIALDTLALKVREQNPLTEIDVDIAKILGTAVSLTNYLPVGVAYPAGTLIDPRAIRALTSTDVVSATLTEPVVTGARGKTTILKANLDAGSNSETLIYTVTALKTFYLVGAHIVVISGATNANYGILHTTTAHAFTNTLLDIRSANKTNQQTAQLPLATPIPFPAGTVFYIFNGSSDGYSVGGIIGWEE